jgi:hypothetical protein
MSAIVEFYRGTAADYLGRRLEQIWQWDHDRLESVHNYIQVLFPNREPSQFNARAPLLDRAAIDAFHADPALRRNLAVSFEVVLRFYGLEYDAAAGRVRRRPDFTERAANWITPYNHNYLRLTRILKCLVGLGLPEHARAFLDCLEAICAEHGKAIGLETLAYWRAAVPADTQPIQRTPP